MPSPPPTSFHVLALDIGTSSARALLFDASARAIGQAAQHSYEQTTSPDGGVECDAEELFNLVVRCIDEVKTEAIGAVACSCFWHSLMAIDRDGNAISPVFSWADNRAAPWIEPLRATLNEQAAHARTGCVFHTSYWPAKLLWLAHTRAELFAENTRWISFGEYLAMKFCGEAKASFSMASGTGIFHQNRCDWDDETLAALPIGRAQLSPLCDANEQAESLPQWKNRWPHLKNAKWFPALGDGACSNLGSGGVDANNLVLNVGTSAAVRVVLKDFTGEAPHGLWRYRIDKRRSVLGGAVSNAGNVWAWANATFKLPPNCEARIAAMPPDSHGLTVLPFLAGERSPIWNAHARFALEGASLDSKPEHILRAALEAASLRFALIAELVRDAMNIECNAAPEILASGGALSRSEAWSQITADCLGATLVESRESEASARGAALMALEACGVIENIADLPAERGARIEANAASTEIYRRALERQNSFYDQIYASSLAPRI